MKKYFITASILLSMSAVASATQLGAEASSAAAVSSYTASANLGSGVSIQDTIVGATNTSTATALKDHGTVTTTATSVGQTFSQSTGLVDNAVGFTGGEAAQSGSAEAWAGFKGFKGHGE